MVVVGFCSLLLFGAGAGAGVVAVAVKLGLSKTWPNLQCFPRGPALAQPAAAGGQFGAPSFRHRNSRGESRASSFQETSMLWKVDLRSFRECAKPWHSRRIVAATVFEHTDSPMKRGLWNFVHKRFSLLKRNAGKSG